jgi:GTP-binding protein
VANYRTIRHELELYSPTLARRTEIVVVTKLDLTGAAESYERIARALGGEVLAISAVTGKGIPALVHRISALLEQVPDSFAAGPEPAGTALSTARGV